MIQVGFSTRQSNFASRLIRWVLGAPYSHVWLLTYDPVFDCQLVLEAGERGFVPRSYASFCANNQVVKVLTPRHQLPLALGLRRSTDLLDEAFDTTGLLGMAWVKFALKYLHRKVKNPLQMHSAVFCSEAVVTVMQAGGYPGADALLSSATDPRTLDEFLSAEATA